MKEHPVEQAIRGLLVFQTNDGEGEYYAVGKNGVSRIEATTKSGMHADIPYIRVWEGEHCIAEFCQHNIVGVYFQKPESEQP
ncbi:MAG: hypothetical protein Dbin4_02554 [Alphaproteobacteria bacterium]|nr:hypothetical protein [Alphaproteobacteria bacterium]